LSPPKLIIKTKLIPYSIESKLIINLPPKILNKKPLIESRLVRSLLTQLPQAENSFLSIMAEITHKFLFFYF